MHVSALHAAVSSNKHLKVNLSRREVLTLMALFTFWQCKIISPSYNLLLERCVGVKRSTMFTAMKSLEDRGLLIRRSFLDCKDGSRHVVFFLDLPGIFTSAAHSSTPTPKRRSQLGTLSRWGELPALRKSSL